MIGFLKGSLVLKQPPLLWLDVQGVGYEIEAPMSTFYALPELDSQVKLLIHMHVREDAMLLFGFATDLERKLFKILIKINGVGARMAIGILSAMSVIEFATLVEHDDIKGLTKIPGVGKKTAERLMIEMRDRLAQLDIVGDSTNIEDKTNKTISFSHTLQYAIDALVGLGYKVGQAEKMVKANQDKSLTLEELIKFALQNVKL